MAVTLKSCALLVDVRSVVKDGLDLSSAEDALPLLKNFAFANGSGDDQAHEHWHDERSLNAATAETLDLTALAGGAFGRVVNFTDVRAILVVNTSNNGDLEIGAAASNIWEPFVKTTGDIALVKKSGLWLWVAPKDATGVVDGTHKSLKVNNAAGSAQTYRIWILGTTS